MTVMMMMMMMNDAFLVLELFVPVTVCEILE